MTVSANAEQIDAWNNRTGLRWAALQERIDTLFVPVTRALMEAAAAGQGERVLDVGCGCGATVLDLARSVGPSGDVLGVDVSTPMLAVAQQRIAAAALTNAALRCADAASAPFEPGARDLVVSRFGVMFFDDPVGAFRNLHAAAAAGARLAFLCWQPLEASGWFREPVEAIRPLLGPVPAADPDAPGPFAFARPDRVRAILREADWSQVAIEPHATTIDLGDVAAATDLVTQVGAAARMLAEVSPAVRAEAREAVAARMAAVSGPGGVRLGGATWLVAARA